VGKILKEVTFYLGSVPRGWLIPRGSRAVLAAISTIFWVGTIWNALENNPGKASVFSLFGLGLFYLVFSLFNLFGGLKSTLVKHRAGHVDESEPRALIELFLVLLSMFVFNVAILAIYAVKGASFTLVDAISVGIDVFLILGIVGVYGYRELFVHPIARGWLAIAGKTVPQLVTAILFLVHPSTASSLALITLLGIDALSMLRFVPALRAFRHNRKDRHLKGLLLGEFGNTASGVLLSLTWLVAHLRLV
jgi:hypothetical protein